MKSTILSLGLIAAVAMASKTKEEIDAEASYAQYCSQFDCTATSFEDYKHKLENFKACNDFINAENTKADLEEMLNPGSQPARYGHNKFCDWSLEELAAAHIIDDILPLDTDDEDESEDESEDEDDRRLLADEKLPNYLDLRRFVRNVSDQGQCGSVWAMVANAAFEGSIAMRFGDKLLLSDQQQIDCNEVSLGCFGGIITSVWDYQQKNGAVLAEDYPYMGTESGIGCLIRPDAQYPKSIKYIPKYRKLTDTSVVGIKRALQDGPVATTINADMKFMFYTNGILRYYEEEDEGFLNHALLIVGYGKDYWIMQNSWGTSWGKEGYVLIDMNKRFDDSWSVKPILPSDM